MGSYLSQPVTDKETHEGENDVFSYGVSAMQGWRTEMVRKKKKERGEGGGEGGEGDQPREPLVRIGRWTLHFAWVCVAASGACPAAGAPPPRLVKKNEWGRQRGRLPRARTRPPANCPR